MLKTLFALLITISAASSGLAQSQINGMSPEKFRQASRSILQSELRSKPRVNDRIALLRQAFHSQIDRHTPATQVMFETAHQLIGEEVAQKTVAFKSSRDADERKALASDIKLLNESLRIYDFAKPQSSSRSFQSKR